MSVKENYGIEGGLPVFEDYFKDKVKVVGYPMIGELLTTIASCWPLNVNVWLISSNISTVDGLNIRSMS